MATVTTTTQRSNTAIAPFFGPLEVKGGVVYVDGVSGKDAGRSGRSPTTPLKTVTQALALVVDDDTVFVNPGVYNESVVVGHELSGITLVGLGVVEIKGQNIQDALLSDSSRLKIKNIKFTGPTIMAGVRSTGDYFLAENCIFSGGATGLVLTEGTSGDIASNSKDGGTAPRIIDCEVSNAVNGILIQATDNGVIDNILVKDCSFFNCTTASINETGGTAASRFRGLRVIGCDFGAGDNAAGSFPTTWINLGGSDSNTGFVKGCSFLKDNTVVGINVVGTKLLWVGNFHPSGLSAGQPA